MKNCLLSQSKSKIKYCFSELLARGAEWSAGVGGDLEEAGDETSQMLRLKHQEMIKHQMMTQLTQATQIKMTIHQPQIKINSSSNMIT